LIPLNHLDSLPIPPETVYTPDSELRHPWAFFRALARDFLASGEMAWVILVRNIKGKYRQTLLGFFWAFVPPIVTTASFVLLESQQIISGKGVGMHYGAFVMVGSLLWQGFVDAVHSPLRMVNSSLSMLSAVRFPREALILAGLGECLFNFAIRLVLLLFVFLYYGLPLSWSLALAPFAVLLLLVAGFVIGLALIPLGMLYHDVEMGLGIGISLWFFLTPVAYATPAEGLLAKVNAWNPVTPLLVTTRELITGTALSQSRSFALVAAASAVLFVAGLAVYRLSMPHIIKRAKV